MTTTTKKITLATLKRFVAANRSRLLVKVSSAFDGMTDGVETNQGARFDPAVATEPPFTSAHNLGIGGVWLVLQSRDYFSAYEDEYRTGISCYNSCGRWTVAIAKAGQA